MLVHTTHSLPCWIWEAALCGKRFNPTPPNVTDRHASHGRVVHLSELKFRNLLTRELRKDLLEIVLEAAVRGDEHRQAVLLHLVEALGGVDPPLVQDRVDGIAKELGDNLRAALQGDGVARRLRRPRHPCVLRLEERETRRIFVDFLDFRDLNSKAKTPKHFCLGLFSL